MDNKEQTRGDRLHETPSNIPFCVPYHNGLLAKDGRARCTIWKMVLSPIIGTCRDSDMT